MTNLGESHLKYIKPKNTHLLRFLRPALAEGVIVLTSCVSLCVCLCVRLTLRDECTEKVTVTDEIF